MVGWIKLHRQLLDSEIFANQTALKIWLWLLLTASTKKRFVSLNVGNGFSEIKLEVGELLFGRFKAEEKLNIDGSTIYKWLKKMEQLEMITIISNNKYSIITICNYESYQQQKIPEVAASEQQRNNNVTTSEQQRNTVKELEEYNKKKEEEIKETINLDFELSKRYLKLQEILENDMLKYWNFDRVNNCDKLNSINMFLDTIIQNKQINNFTKNFYSYKKLRSGENIIFRKDIYKFMGTIESKYLDGVWNVENWLEKLKTEDINEFNKVKKELSKIKENAELSK